MERCFVVTRNGWDDVLGVYIANTEREVAERFLIDRDIDDVGTADAKDWLEDKGYIIHYKSITNLNKGE